MVAKPRRSELRHYKNSSTLDSVRAPLQKTDPQRPPALRAPARVQAPALIPYVSSWTRFVDDVKWCFRGSAKTGEASGGDDFANAFFAGLRAQA